MSDFRAVAAMTRTLQNILQDAVADIQGAHARTARPEKDAPEHRHGLVNIFLYQVETNPSWRNMELPVRRGDGSVIQRPQVALDLHYLLSFYGDESQQIPQLLLGKTVTALHSFPNPSPRYLPRTPADGSDPDGMDLAGSGLADQIHLLRFTPISLNHEELSKLWTIFFQVPYALSIAIRCSVILIQPDDVVPEPVLPVRRARLYDVAQTLPEIEQVVPQILESSAGARLLLRGRNLSAPGTRVQASGLEASILAATAGSLTIELPPGLAAGGHLVTVTRDVEMGDPPEPRRIFESNPASFILQPRVDAVAHTEEDQAPAIVVTVAPDVRPGQRLSLLLNDMEAAAPAPRNYTLAAVPGAAGREVRFPARGVEPGTYLVRIAVDGVSSRLGTDPDPTSPTFDRYDRPVLEIS